MTNTGRHRVVSAGIGLSVAVILAVGSTDVLTRHNLQPVGQRPFAEQAALVTAAVTTEVTPAPVTPSTPVTPSLPPTQASTATLSRQASTPTPFTPAPVAALTSLASPDAWVQLSAPLTPGELAAVRAIPAITDVTPVSTGTVTVNGTAQKALAVDPSSFRRVTPAPTADSDALWAAVAAGNLATEITRDALPSTLVGHSITVQARGTRQVRLGALAAFGLPDASVVMSLSRGGQLGLSPMTGLIISAPTVSPHALIDELAEATGGHADLLGPDAAEADIAGGTNAKGLPATWNGLFQQAASSCPGLSWTVLAAIGQIESGDGQNDGPSSKGAVGPMQFLPATFAEYAVDGDHDGKKNPLDAYDAVPTAARMLCSDGAGEGPAQLKAAVFDYNHADWYVAEVIALAARYR